MTPAALLKECKRLGIGVRRNGQHLEVGPVKRLTPELVASLRKFKPAILQILDASPLGLPEDEVPWVPTANQILHGEFDSAPRSMLQSLLTGVRNIRHPACQKAAQRLRLLLGEDQA